MTRRKGGRKWVAGMGVTALLIFLISFNNMVGYIGNAVVDTENQWVWWTITAICGVVTGTIEIMQRR